MKYFVEVKSAGSKGRGVFALKKFNPGEIIESCPIIYLGIKDAKLTEFTVLDRYVYEWKSTKDGALPLGYGLIYNHSFSPNAVYKRDFSRNLMDYVAIKPISRGEEITVNYNGDPDDHSEIPWIPA